MRGCFLCNVLRKYCQTALRREKFHCVTKNILGLKVEMVVDFSAKIAK